MWSVFYFPSLSLLISLPSQIIPAVLSKIYVFAGIIPANPRDPIARAAGGMIVNDLLVSEVLSAEGADLQMLFSNLELGVR
jgi:hypothetical protein